MKTLQMTSEIAQSIVTTVENIEYLTWADGSQITQEEIENQFHITIYDNDSVNIEHNTHDFRVENLILENLIN